MGETKKRNLLILLVSFGMAILVWCIVQVSVKKNAKQVFTSKVYKEPTGWGYDIYKNGALYIKQNFVPVAAGRAPFVKKGQAGKAAAMVIEKLNKGQLPSLDKNEIALILSFAE